MLLLLLPAAGWAAAIPSRFGIDAPELAQLGRYAVGFKTLRLQDRAQIDVLAYDPVRAAAPRRDRELDVDLWYPARLKSGSSPVVYTGVLPSEVPSSPAFFNVPGIAVRNAAPVEERFALVIVSHGYSNDPAAMTWLTENLASKGYVVAAIHHHDPRIGDRSKMSEPLLRRPLDIAFVARSLQRMLKGQLVEPERSALIGYSAGGYGVLTAAGAELDPSGPVAHIVPGGLLLPYAKQGALADSIHVTGLRAVVAIAPWGGGVLASWGAEGLRALTVPLLLIAGDHDRTVDYASGARAFFDAAVNAQRYLLTFKYAGHSLGLSPAPAQMRRRLWDQDWFEDPVWSKERINSINAHFITAFLDRYVKGDETRAAYLDVAVPESSDGVWPAESASAAYDAVSPASGGVTIWKGFKRGHAEGLELLRAAPSNGTP